MDQKKTYLKIIGVGTASLIVGFIAGRQMPPQKEQVRTAMYQACVNGSSYTPTSGNRTGDSLGCNRRRIDLTIATVYGESYIEPMPDDARADYEKVLQKYKRR